MSHRAVIALGAGAFAGWFGRYAFPRESNPSAPRSVRSTSVGSGAVTIGTQSIKGGTDIVGMYGRQYRAVLDAYGGTPVEDPGVGFLNSPNTPMDVAEDIVFYWIAQSRRAPFTFPARFQALGNKHLWGSEPLTGDKSFRFWRDLKELVLDLSLELDSVTAFELQLEQAASDVAALPGVISDTAEGVVSGLKVGGVVVIALVGLAGFAGFLLVRKELRS